MGSKRRVSKYILPIILPYRKPNQYWVEPFVGGGNMIDKVSNPRIGADINPYVIQALTSIRDYINEIPKNNTEFTKEDYQKLKLSDDYKHKGYIGHIAAFGGIWLHTWAFDILHSDYIAKGYRNAVKQSPKLQGVELYNCSYDELVIPPNSLIYCDLPYKGSTEYRHEFDHDKFWEWCRVMSNSGHTVFVSESSAPDDFQCLWSREHSTPLDKYNVKTYTEALFALNGHVDIDCCLYGL